MKSIFDLNGSFIYILTKIFDLFILNLLWLLCSIPIITFGPATCALYYTLVKSIRRDRGYVLKEFLQAFKTNLKQGLFVGILNFVLFFVMYFNISYTISSNSQDKSNTLVLYYVISFVFYILFLYIYPILSRFNITTKNLFVNSFLMALRHFFSTIIMGILLLGCIYVLRKYPLAVFFLPVLCCYLISMVMERVLVKYLPEDTKDSNEWYNET